MSSATGEKSCRVQRLIGSGYACPHTPEVGDDWAVLQLREAVDGLPPEHDYARDGDPVIAVAAAAMDFWRIDRHSGKKTHPKSMRRTPCLTIRITDTHRNREPGTGNREPASSSNVIRFGARSMPN